MYILWSFIPWVGVGGEVFFKPVGGSCITLIYDLTLLLLVSVLLQ